MKQKNFGAESTGGGSSGFTGTPYQDFVATEGQTDYVVTVATLTDYFHVTVDNTADYPATKSSQTVTISAQGAGAKVRIYA